MPGAVRATIAAAALVAAVGAFAQGGTSPIRILVGFPPGGNIDSVARYLADAMRTALGQTVVVENRSGAGGQVAAQALKAAAPDGNTLMLSNEHAVAFITLTLKNPGYDPRKDFSPVATVATLPIAIAVHPSTKSTTLADFGAWTRTKGVPANVGVPAPASLPDFAVKLIGKGIGADLTSVPYRGGAPMVADLLGGQVPAGVTGLTELLPHYRSGAIRILAVSGDARSPLLPDVPAFGELGVKHLDEPVFMGLFAPAGTAAAVLTRYNDVLRAVLAKSGTQEHLDTLGARAAYGGPDDLRRRVERTIENWAPIVEQSGYKPQ